MFERFTDHARRVLVLAQEEARLLNHPFIGTEHLLLGLIHEDEGIAALALAQMDISLEAVREMVVEILGVFPAAPVGSPPFTPRAKKALELSLREALQLGHNYISTEHLLLGVIREGEGVAAEVLVSLGAGLAEMRERVIALLPGEREEAGGPPHPSRPGRWRAYSSSTAEDAACSFCGRQRPETGQLFAGNDVSICEHCVRQWSAGLDADEGSEGD